MIMAELRRKIDPRKNNFFLPGYVKKGLLFLFNPRGLQSHRTMVVPVKSAQIICKAEKYSGFIKGNRIFLADQKTLL